MEPKYEYSPVTDAEIDQVFTAHFKMLKLWREYRCVPNRMSEAVRYYVWLHLERTEANAKQDAKVDLWIRDPVKQIYESQGDVLLFRDGSVLTLDQIYDDKDAYLQDILSDSEHEKLVRAERAAEASASDLPPPSPERPKCWKTSLHSMKGTAISCTSGSQEFCWIWVINCGA